MSLPQWGYVDLPDHYESRTVADHGLLQVQNPIDLPQIAVVGSQSSGKSSVLENIVGRDLYGSTSSGEQDI